MTDKVTYYAMFDEDTSKERPRTVFRRVRSDSGQIDELFSRDLKWEFSSLLYSAERGDTMFDFTEITEEEAFRIVDRILAEASGGEV